MDRPLCECCSEPMVKGGRQRNGRPRWRCADKARRRSLQYSRTHTGREKQRKYRKENPRQDKDLDIYLRRLYGLSASMFESVASDGCMICGHLPREGERRLHVDHEHVEGWDRMDSETRLTYVRGVLCSHCNTGLGMFRDCPERLAAAIAYLGQPSLLQFLR